MNIPFSSTHKTRCLDLGCTDYDAAYARQQQLQKLCYEEGIEGVILCEHPPVITCGRMSHDENFLIPKEEISAKGVTIRNIDRGGDLTLHGPGQLVVYPILDLAKRGRDLHKYLNSLEEIGISVLNDFGLNGQRNSSSTGVWVEGRKIMSIGIGVKKWVSYHGLSINVSTDLALFSLIRPCGLNARITSMEKQLGTSVDMAQVKERTRCHLSRIFGLEFIHE